MQGRADFVCFKPRPSTPPDDDNWKPTYNRWVGWMIARADAIGKIHKSTEDEGTRRRKITLLDYEHGLLWPTKE